MSISPDGLWAAVGHDALVTYQSLADLTAAPTLLNVSAEVGDLVLDGSGKVHVFPATDQWVNVHSIDIASNTERLQYSLYAGTKARLHPNGTSIYGANNGLSPDDIQHFGLNSGVGEWPPDSPYHGDYPMCGNLWFSEDGASIYIACGRTFRASADAAQDMRYTGALQLSSSTSYGYRVLSLSQSAARREVVLVEQPWYECGVGTCLDRCPRRGAACRQFDPGVIDVLILSGYILASPRHFTRNDPATHRHLDCLRRTRASRNGGAPRRCRPRETLCRWPSRSPRPHLRRLLEPADRSGLARVGCRCSRAPAFAARSCRARA